MEAKVVIASLSALAHEHRLATFRFLMEAGPNGTSAGTISDRLGIPPSSMTFHLQQLLHAGLITSRRVSRQIFYAADYRIMNDLVGYLTENCCGTGAGACETPRAKTIVGRGPACRTAF